MKKSNNTIKTEVLNSMENGRVYSRQELCKLYEAAHDKVETHRYYGQWHGNLTLSLWQSHSQWSKGGYFCYPTEIEPRYIKRIARNQYVIAE